MFLLPAICFVVLTSTTLIRISTVTCHVKFDNNAIFSVHMRQYRHPVHNELFLLYNAGCRVNTKPLSICLHLPASRCRGRPRTMAVSFLYESNWAYLPVYCDMIVHGLLNSRVLGYLVVHGSHACSGGSNGRDKTMHPQQPESVWPSVEYEWRGENKKVWQDGYFRIRDLAPIVLFHFANCGSATARFLRILLRYRA